ncbi:ABC transporter substrate-binding protein [Natrarchaeobaculum aegyptiacum]|uniref:Ferrichrome ABC transporter substrate-binding protein n=1 Tax=Natrarchaeobaculum aegyptiacum TaxID=745377 RepID=A0A2Z2HUQ0_9EURY|nr:ABC transporter substrate-binding protein [Natrarchaeobaculum aegyptiacum]ARS90910.1 ferrichrome ABC transporter substrate-binding protein [Natrarchaeobaculum aegyptiacum]
MGERPTRRAVLAAGGTGVAAALAGCASRSGDRPGDDGTRAHETYTVTMEPMGDVEFSSVPETFVGRFGFVVDVAAALDELDSLVAMYSTYSVFGHSHFYDELETVSIDPAEIEELHTDDWDIRLERLYDLAPDVTAIDPNYLIHYTQFDEDEVDRFVDRVGPFVHNESQSGRPDGWPTWPDGDYPYLTLAELTRRYGETFQKTARAEAILELNEDVRDTITSRLPPESERPTVAVGSLHDGTWHLDTFADAPASTYGEKHYRDLGAIDAVAEYGSGRVQAELELLLEIDPDVFVWRHGLFDPDGVTETFEELEDDTLASQLACVDSGRFYVGGSPDQGPIVNTFQMEMLAKQLYPDEFGAYHEFGKIPTDDQLFDRTRVDEIVRGEGLE